MLVFAGRSCHKLFSQATDWFWIDCLQASQSIHTLTFHFLKVFVHVIISDRLNQTARSYEIQVTRYFVAVTSECRVTRFICKTWTGTLANSADPDQTPQNAASDQSLHCLRKLQKG